MGIKSRRKGKVGERAAAAALEELLHIPLRRGVQYKGTPDSPDIAGLEEVGLHCEVKRDETTIGKTLYRALSQAEEDAGNYTPFVLSRRNYEDWVIALKLSDVVSFARAIVEAVDGDSG